MIVLADLLGHLVKHLRAFAYASFVRNGHSQVEQELPGDIEHASAPEGHLWIHPQARRAAELLPRLPKPDEHLSEAWVVETIEHISTSLTAMHTFDWDGLELPNDSLWVTLRSKCVSHPSAPPRPLTPSSCPELRAYSPMSARDRSIQIARCSISQTSPVSRSSCAMASADQVCGCAHRNCTGILTANRTFPGAGAHTPPVLGHAHQPMPRPARTCHMQLLFVSACV